MEGNKHAVEGVKRTLSAGGQTTGQTGYSPPVQASSYQQPSAPTSQQQTVQAAPQTPPAVYYDGANNPLFKDEQSGYLYLIDPSGQSQWCNPPLHMDLQGYVYNQQTGQLDTQGHFPPAIQPPPSAPPPPAVSQAAQFSRIQGAYPSTYGFHTAFNPHGVPPGHTALQDRQKQHHSGYYMPQDADFQQHAYAAFQQHDFGYYAAFQQQPVQSHQGYSPQPSAPPQPSAAPPRDDGSQRGGGFGFRAP